MKRAVEKSSNTVFAAKYIKLSRISSRDDIMKEMEIMNRLHHKRLVGLVDGFELPREVVMIMEL